MLRALTTVLVLTACGTGEIGQETEPTPSATATATAEPTPRATPRPAPANRVTPRATARATPTPDPREDLRIAGIGFTECDQSTSVAIIFENPNLDRWSLPSWDLAVESHRSMTGRTSQRRRGEAA